MSGQRVGPSPAAPDAGAAVQPRVGVFRKRLSTSCARGGKYTRGQRCFCRTCPKDVDGRTGEMTQVGVRLSLQGPQRPRRAGRPLSIRLLPFPARPRHTPVPADVQGRDARGSGEAPLSAHGDVETAPGGPAFPCSTSHLGSPGGQTPHPGLSDSQRRNGIIGRTREES